MLKLIHHHKTYYIKRNYRVNKRKLAGVIGIGLLMVGCTTSIPKLNSSESTLVLAPFEANADAKISAVWVIEYVLNNNPDMTMLVDPMSASGNFVTVENLAPNNYQVTSFKWVKASRGKFRALGNSETRELPPQDYISFEVKAGEITIFPITTIYEYQKVGNDNQISLRSYPRLQTEKERKMMFAEVKQLDNVAEWKISN